MFSTKSVAFLCVPIVLALGIQGCKIDPTAPPPASNNAKVKVLDILWVLDNSGSMKPRVEYIKTNIGGFITRLQASGAVRFRMAATSTDFIKYQGELLGPAAGPKIVDKDTSQNPEAEFAAIVDSMKDSLSSFWEQGRESMHQALANHGQEFLRDEAALAIIFVTDADDFSCESNCVVSPEANPNYVRFADSRYFDQLKELKQTREVLVYPMVGTPQSTCGVESPGTYYIDLQKEVGGIGISSSICEADLPAAYENIAASLASF